jgi:hypothetical protein
MKWVGHIARMGERRGAYRLLVEKSEGRRPLGRPKYRWENNIKIDLQEVEWRGINLIDLVQGRERWRDPVNEVLNLRLP